MSCSLIQKSLSHFGHCLTSMGMVRLLAG